MKLYLSMWIIISGLMLKPGYASSETTVTDSSILNLVIESSTNSNIDKPLKTILNSSNLFSFNSVNTGHQQSTVASEDCKNGDCSKHSLTSPNTDNSSSVSKIVWNLVSTVKSSTVHPLSSEVNSVDRSTVPTSNPHSYNHSSGHNSSLYSSDNELDSEISFENHLPEIHATHSSEIIKSSFIDHEENFRTTATDSSLGHPENFFTTALEGLNDHQETLSISETESPVSHQEKLSTSSTESFLDHQEKLSTSETGSSLGHQVKLSTSETEPSVKHEEQFPISGTESSEVTTKIINASNELDENDTLAWESTEMHSEIITLNDSASDFWNITENSITSSIQETTVPPSEEELDFSTLYTDSLHSSDTLNKFHSESTPSSYSYSSETSYSPTDASLNLERNNLRTSSVVYYDDSSDSREVESTEVKASESEFRTSKSMSKIPFVLDNNENSTSFYLNYDSSLEAEELTSEEMEMVNITDSGESTHFSPSISVASTENNLENVREEITSTISSNIFTTSESFLTNDFERKSTTLTAENQSTHSESDKHKDMTDNIDPVPSVTGSRILWRGITSNSSESNEDMDYALNSTEETYILTSQEPEFNLIHDSSEKFPDKIMNEISTVESADTSKSSASQDTKLSTESTWFSSEESSSDSFEDSTERSYTLNTTFSYNLPILEIMKQNVSNYTVDSTEKNSYILNNTFSYDLPISEIMKQNLSQFINNMDSNHENKKDISTSSYDSITTNTDSNSNIVYLDTLQDISTEKSNYSINEIDASLSSLETNETAISSGSNVEDNASTELLASTESSVTFSPIMKDNFKTDMSITDEIRDITTAESNLSPKTTHYEYSDEEYTSTENFDNKTYIPTVNPDIVSSDKENIDEATTEKSFSDTENEAVESFADNTIPIMTDESEIHTKSTLSVLSSDYPSVTTNKPQTYSEDNHSESETSEIIPTESGLKATSIEKETMKGNSSENGIITNQSHFETASISTSSSTEITSPNSSEISSGITETHREGKHIPFSSTVVRTTTTQYPRIFINTSKTYPTETDTTENNFVNLLYNQIKADNLSPDERSNLINAVIRLPDKYYSKEVLNEKIAIIHLWLLHAVADEYKNATLTSSGSNDAQMDEIEFENLPQILYVLPTPEVHLPNISFTFIIHNKWRNATFPADIVLTILNLHTENLKHLVQIEEIHFSHGLLVQKHDLLAVIIEKYGIILLSTCIITVGMIMLLICVVIYYRRKTRHSAHCLTDDKLHRNMREAMGLDLNPAVIILQEEIREKAALNGNKICSLDDDEGWLAPIGEVPVEDNNAPFVQDTKL